MNGQPGQIIDILENFAFENDDHPWSPMINDDNLWTPITMDGEECSRMNDSYH